MSMPDLYSMQSEDEDLDLGIVFASSEDTLKLFGSCYMQNSQTTGTLKILNPKGAKTASFDIWQNKWVEAADEGS